MNCRTDAKVFPLLMFLRGAPGLGGPVFRASWLVACMALGCVTTSAVAEAAPSITAPAAGARWSVDSQHAIAWQGAAPVAGAKVHIELSADGGQSWAEIAAAAPDSGSFLWKVPDRISDRYRIRITQSGTAAPATSGLFAVIPSQQVADYRWTQVTPKAAFAPRDGAGALVFRGRMWLLGGWNPGDKRHFPRICNNEVWSSPDGAAWTLVKPNTFLDATFDATRDWEGRHTGGYVVYRDKMWLVGGDANQGHYQSDVWSSADGAAWTLVNKDRPVPWGPRALHHTLVFRDKIWVLGGQTMPAFGGGEERFYRDIWTTSDGVEWNEVKPVEPHWSPRGMIEGSVVLGDRIWILGGGTYDTPTTPKRNYYNDVWSSADGIHWTQHTAAAPWPPRQYHEVAAYDGRMWVAEGYNGNAGGNRKDVWYSSDGVNWYEVPNTPWAPRHAASIYVHAGALWIVAGNNMQSDVWKLQRAGGKPQQPPPSP